MTARLRYGLIGCGMMGREHIANLALIDGAEVTAVADPDETQRGLAAMAAPGAAVMKDHRELLARDDVDAVVVASPNHTHWPVMRDVLASRPRAALLEKPAATTLQDCEALRRAASGWPAPLWVAMEYRYMPPIARLVEAAHAGEAGRPVMLTIREHRFPFLAKIGDWNRFSENTGGTLVEKCCHFFDLMRLILGDEPVRVYASAGMDANHLDERYGGRAPDMLDNAYVVLDFRGGARAMLELCMFAEGAWHQEEIALTGDRARLSCRIPGPARFWPGGAERVAEFEIAPRSPKGPVVERIEVDPHILAAGDHHGGTYHQHRRFFAAATGGGPVEVTLEDGLSAVAIGAAAERSAREHVPVAL